MGDHADALLGRLERIDGRWLFRRRSPHYWYATDLNKPPVGDEEPQVAEPAPLGEFLISMRRGAPEPRIRVR